MSIHSAEQTFRCFKRSARNFEEFAVAHKTYVGKPMTYTEAQNACRVFNTNRTKSQIAKGTKMEFEQA